MKVRMYRYFRKQIDIIWQEVKYNLKKSKVNNYKVGKIFF